MNDPNINKVASENIEVAFSINTKRDYFIDWLTEKFLLSGNPQLREALKNLPNKRFSDMLKISGIHPEEPQLVVIDKSKDSKDAKGRVFFKITTIGENRIEVSSGYTGNVFVAFSETLLMIVKTYNESGEPIVHYLESKILPNNSSLEKINSDEQEIRVIDIKGNVNGSILISGNNNQVNINQSTQEPIG